MLIIAVLSNTSISFYTAIPTVYLWQIETENEDAFSFQTQNCQCQRFSVLILGPQSTSGF